MPEPSWREVMSTEDEAVLAGYARPRRAFSGTAPTLVVIDVTESFFGPDLPVLEAQKTTRQACGSRAWRTLPWTTRILGHFRQHSLPVVFTVPDANQSWAGAATRGAVSASQATTLMIEPEPGETVIAKAKASAFFGTSLISGLLSRRCDSVVLAGGTTSGCVRATAVDATSYGFDVLVPEEACFDRAALSHAVALREIEAKYGRVLPAEEVIRLVSYHS